MITTYKAYLQPRRVAIPLGTLDESHIAVKIDDAIKIGQPLTYAENEFPYSTVSGKVLQIIRSVDYNNQDTYTVVIENNYKNTVKSNITKKDIKDLIVTYFKPSQKLEKIHFTKEMDIIINLAHHNEPFVSLDVKHVHDLKDTIMGTLHSLNDIWSFKSITLLLTEDMRSSWFSSKTLPITIKKIKPEKRINTPHDLINSMFKRALYKKKPYNYLTLSSILKLHDMIQHHRPSVFTRLVISGEGVKNPVIFTVRVGTMFTDIKRIFNGYSTTNPMTMHLNSIIENITILNENFSIQDHFVSLHFQEHREKEVYDCIACGRCNNECPVGILPSKIMHSLKQGIVLDYMKSDVCIECGLCSYYCPSKIPVMHFVKDAKKLLKGDYE
jgi:Na+-translocating ferredoxin:NAD+ oxidoreductase subunit C